MANLNETATYEASIYKLEKTDPVEGGTPTFDDGTPTAGWSNAQAQQLANRTTWLKGFVDALGAFQAAPGNYGDNVDDLKATGLYYVQNAASNKPTTGNFIVQVVAAGANNEVFQFAFKASSGDSYYRTFDGADWLDWNQYALKSNLDLIGTFNVSAPAYTSDMNSMGSGGFFVSGAATNTPDDTKDYMVLSQKSDGPESTMQLALEMSTNLLYVRTRDADDWSTWDLLSVGVGTVRTAFTTPGTNWMLCNGDLISRTTYADLFGIIGTEYGSGDGATTFQLPSFTFTDDPAGNLQYWIKVQS